MGTPVIRNPVGVECVNWDPPAETPTFIYAFFYDILKGDMFGAFEPPNNHVFKMSQVDGHPCHWQALNIAYCWKVYLGIDFAQTWLTLQDTVHPANFYFTRTLPFAPPPEYQLFTNFFQHPFDNWGYEGFAIIFWFDGIDWIAEAFGLDDVDDLMLEIFPIDADNIVIKLCSSRLVTNIKFKFTP